MKLKSLSKTIMAIPLIAVLSVKSHLSVEAAGKKPATNYVQFDCEPEANFFSMNSLDYRVSEGALPKSENLFLNSTQKDKPDEVIFISKCRIGEKDLRLDRVFLNLPNDRGNLCATLDWGVFQLTADGKLVGEFISGCSFDIHVFTNEFNLHICKSDFNETTCKTLAWQDVKNDKFSPLKVGLLGDWL